MADVQRRVGAPKPSLPGTCMDRRGEITAMTDGTLVPGDFAFKAVSEYGQELNFVSKTGSRLIGVVVRGFYYYGQGQSIPIAPIGRIYAAVPEGQTPSSGQAVLCDPATGEVTYGKAGDPNDTGWKVHACDPGNGLVIYEKL